MAKGNVLLGYARGSVGDVTFSRMNGQQISKARNRQPNNPKTLKQCYVRGRFAAAVKFFTRGRQAFFKFAYEDAKITESDYNAFMRHNVAMSPSISKAAFDNYDYPVIAPYLMTKGSLQPIDCAFSSGVAQMIFPVAASETLPTTIGDLSTLLITNEDYLPGDIVTMVSISSDYAGSVPSVDADGEGKSSWVIRQFIVDTSSTDTIATTLGVTVADVGGYLAFTLASATSPLDGTYNAFTCVHSRETTSGLAVSSQELVLDTAATTVYENSFTEAYKQEVSVSWQKGNTVDVQPEAILQGSIAYDN